ncbi:hypothetical protein DEO72_LG1g3069 [Vigna unguiculata]|uniref:Uncharacterized protein n=1 Tax=Vigna unguiculata TaxID=3917 RepID=A0A4D6KP26_VIGUN|nr:hypothetical protein DEO72_LG1g3069 [Vigna unguiculata]
MKFSHDLSSVSQPQPIENLSSVSFPSRRSISVVPSDLRRALPSPSCPPISVAPSHLRRTLPSSSCHHRHAVAPSPSALSSSLHLSRVVSVSPFRRCAISFCGDSDIAIEGCCLYFLSW